MARGGKTDRKQKKARARQRAKRKQKTAARQSAQASVANEMARASDWPVVHCFVNEGWQSREALAQVVVARRAEGSVALAVFLVDLQCLGVKNCLPRPSLSASEYQEFVDAYTKRWSLVPCSPEQAAAIVSGGVDYAADLGFEPHADFELGRPLLAGLDPEAAEVPVVCGGPDDKPLYIAGPNDNARRVLAQLERRLGAGGFDFVATGADVGGHEGPGSVAPLLGDGLVAAIDDDAALLRAKPPKDLEGRLRRAGALKRALLAFAMGSQMTTERDTFFESNHRHGQAPDDDIAAVERFVFHHQLSDGRCLIDAFIADPASRLHPQDRDLLSTWREPLIGVLRVDGMEQDHVRLHNLIDDLDYPAQSTLGTAWLRERMPAGGFVVTRLVPFGDGWLFSGSMDHVPAEEADAAWLIAARLARDCPSLVLRNPELMRRSWELQAAEAAEFEACFGAREVIVPGRKLPRVLAQFREHQWNRLARELPTPPETPPLTAQQIRGTLPPPLVQARCVGLLHDDRWGMGMYVDYDRLLECMKNPNLLDSRSHADVVIAFLESDAVDPLPIERVCGQHPEGASAVLGRLLGRPEFRWSTDGDALLHEIKPDEYEGLTPRLTAFPSRLARAVAKL